MMAKTPVRKKTSEQSKVQIELPVAIPVGYQAAFIRTDVRILSANQKAGLAAVFSALTEQGEKLENGTPITKPVHAIKFMLEKINADNQLTA